jgi:hypothetical protein
VKISSILQFKGGQSNPTFYLKTSQGKEFVLRKKPPGKLLATAVRFEVSRISPFQFLFGFVDVVGRADLVAFRSTLLSANIVF